jgi:hypothetical protein
LKPSRWTDASLYASLPKKTNNQLGYSTGLGGLHSPPFYISWRAKRPRFQPLRWISGIVVTEAKPANDPSQADKTIKM